MGMLEAGETIRQIIDFAAKLDGIDAGLLNHCILDRRVF
jgi:hypothetical protein